MLYIFLLSLHDYDVKLPNFTLSDLQKKKEVSSLSSGVMYSPLEFTSKKTCKYLTNCSKLSNLNRNALFASLLFCYLLLSHIVARANSFKFVFHLTINWPKRPNSQRTRGCRTPCSFYPRNINWPNKRVKKSVYHFGVFMLFTTTAASAGCIIHTIFNLYVRAKY